MAQIVAFLRKFDPVSYLHWPDDKKTEQVKACSAKKFLYVPSDGALYCFSV